MSAASGGGPGGKPPDTHLLVKPTSANHLPGQMTNHSAWTGIGATGGNYPNSRNFSQIISEEKANWNIIEIKLTKITTTNPENPGNILKGPSLNFDDLGELIFDILKIDPNHCLTFDYNTGRYDTKQIKLKPNINTETYVTASPITFKEHLVTVSLQQHDVTRVTFKNFLLMYQTRKSFISANIMVNLLTTKSTMKS